MNDAGSLAGIEHIKQRVIEQKSRIYIGLHHSLPFFKWVMGNGAFRTQSRGVMHQAV
jgi:hypothetical protein